MLASKYTTFAASTLDGALNVADKYVDKYLPADVFDEQGVDGEWISKCSLSLSVVDMTIVQ